MQRDATRAKLFTAVISFRYKLAFL